jgi:hypothetical protein
VAAQNRSPDIMKFEIDRCDTVKPAKEGVAGRNTTTATPKAIIHRTKQTTTALKKKRRHNNRQS